MLFARASDSSISVRLAGLKVCSFAEDRQLDHKTHHRELHIISSHRDTAGQGSHQDRYQQGPHDIMAGKTRVSVKTKKLCGKAVVKDDCVDGRFWQSRRFFFMRD
jgi:hypothetical protein